MTLAPGKKDWYCDRDLLQDLAALRNEFHADVLVSLLEDFEYHDLKITDLVSRARELGIEQRAFAIPDGSTPAREDMPRFRELLDGVVASLESGKVVVVHCRGGLGRTGTVVACCLVRLGHSPDEAMAITRQARRGAIECEVQEEWVRRYAGVVGP
jgi:protein-tyrosine phosphatase